LPRLPSLLAIAAVLALAAEAVPVPAAPARLDVIRILDFWPGCGPAGTAVTILGLHFTRQYPLAFGGVATGNWNLVSGRMIQAVVPEGAVTGPISLGPYRSGKAFVVTAGPCAAVSAP
jgi:hypothetical protein